MIDKKYFCYEIYKNLAIWSAPNGQVGYSPCSYYNGYFEELDCIDIDKVWNSDGRKKLIQLIETDQSIPGCQQCYKAEDAGLESRRMGAKKQYEIFVNDTGIDLTGPQSVDYSVSNLCNLKCVICGPQNSSSWIPDYQKIYPEKSIEIFKHNKNHKINFGNIESFKNIKVVHLHGGGEPLMSDNHVLLLETIQQVRGLSDVRVLYNTNGTVKVTDHVLELWSQCQLVELYFSIDDVSQRFEYQRTGASWAELNNNIQWYRENMTHNHMFNINCVWSYLNFFYLNELVDWYRSTLYTNRYGDSTNLLFQKAIGKFSLDVISTDINLILTDKFKNYPALLGLLNSLKIDDSYDHQKFRDSVRLIDNVRSQKFDIVCPEWSQLL
jgi:hypothetical protein